MLYWSILFDVPELSPELAVSVSVQSLVPPAQGQSHRCQILCQILTKSATKSKVQTILTFGHLQEKAASPEE